MTGIDLSAEMVKHAKSQEKKDRLRIRYYVSDSADLSMFPAKRFDLARAKTIQRTIREIARVMKDDGRFIFSITHPCFEYSAESREIEKTARYFGIRSERVPWRMERLLRPFETTCFHRTLTDYSNALRKRGLLTRRLLEPKPTRNGPAKFAPLKQVLLRPHSIIFETIKDITKDARAYITPKPRTPSETLKYMNNVSYE